MNPSVDHKIDIGRELQQAVQCHKAGQFESAEQGYRKILQIMPDHADALHLLGLIYGEMGALQRAKELIKRAIKIDEGEPVFYVSFGDILQCEGNHVDATDYYRKALELKPDMVEALCNLGNALREQGLYQQAINSYKKSQSVNPRLPDIYNNMGLAYHLQEQYDSAEACFRKAITLNPDYVEAYNNLGNVYRDITDFKAAIVSYQRALSLAPDNTTINYNLGLLFHSRGAEDDAIGCYQKAVENFPPIADAYNNLGKLYQDWNQPDRAIYHFDKAIELDPEHYDAHFNRSLSLLATGRFEEGWKAYEWRFKRDGWQKIYPHRLEDPRWDGRKFPGKSLFVHSEQGFGDTIWLIRYLPMVKSLGGHLILETRNELIDLLQNFAGIDQLVSMSVDHPPRAAYDFHIPLMSLPGIFGTTLQTIPASLPYLYASHIKREQWAAHITGSGIKIGLVWAAKSTNEHGRSCPLEKFLQLCNLNNVQIYGLQKGGEADQVDALPADINNLGPSFETFADTAGAIACLDLVISVDTAVAHLAGAMGIPVWILLPYAADWKWLMDRNDSPWYPTMRLFRQPRPGDWESAMSMLIVELKQLAR